MRLAEGITRALDRLYVGPVAALMPRELFRYAACGGVTYLVLDPVLYALVYNFVVGHRYFDLGWVVLSPHIAAMIVVFPITLFCGFWLNRNVAFRKSAGEAFAASTGGQLFRYLVTVGGSILLTYGGLKLFVEVCGLWPTPAKVLTTCLTTLYSFLAGKFFTFR